jgi:hypothetical protein
MARTIRSDSSNRATRVPAPPERVELVRAVAEPDPNTARPSLSTSRVAICSAMSTGLTIDSRMIPVAARIVGATADRWVSHGTGW